MYTNQSAEGGERGRRGHLSVGEQLVENAELGRSGWESTILENEVNNLCRCEQGKKLTEARAA